jgi:hypothetical protein
MTNEGDSRAREIARIKDTLAVLDLLNCLVTLKKENNSFLATFNKEVDSRILEEFMFRFDVYWVGDREDTHTAIVFSL